MTNKPKLFKCTSCGRKSDHLTTRWDKGDEVLLDKSEKLCKRCMNKRLDGTELSTVEMFKQMSQEEQMEILKQLQA